MNAGSKGSTLIPSDPHRMVSATCPAVAASGRLMMIKHQSPSTEMRNDLQHDARVRI